MLLMDVHAEFIFMRTYSRYLADQGRRETYQEAVDRYCAYLFSRAHNFQLIPEKTKRKIHESMMALNVLPSMRLFWSAGAACDVSNASAYNCAALAPTDVLAFGEALLLLMSGAGVGFSVERRYVDQLPKVEFQKNLPVSAMTIRDSKFGWQEALNAGVALWFAGRDIQFSYECLRPMGAPLVKMGGRSSGPEVLRELLNYTRDAILGAQGRKLRPIEIHDVMMAIARCVVVGGVRRSAMISLSDLDDAEMRDAKKVPFPPARYGSNNSATYYTRPDDRAFMREFSSLADSGTGERGIVNIYGARKNAPHRRKSKLISLVNPCTEVTLRPRELCNLSTFAVRADDTFDSIRDRVTTAAWIGILQSTLTNFPGLSPDWKANCEDERLCGVSPTGVLDCPSFLEEKYLELWKQQTVSTLRKASKILDINMPAAATCVKPSGTASNLMDSSAGIHPRWSQYYRHNIQISMTDPLFRLMADQDVPWRPTPDDPSTAILSFPVASPRNAVLRSDLDAIQQLENYKKLAVNWAEMSVSATIYVKDDEWLRVAEWTHRNFEIVNGLSYFPAEGNKYSWTPYETMTEEEFDKAANAFPKVDFSQLPKYEGDDQTTGAKEFACVGGGCDA
jgi:ribonucleoside-triphosphate reductase (thioredoxin)